jgi:hypothetical protein
VHGWARRFPALSTNFQTFTLTDPDWEFVSRAVFQPLAPGGGIGLAAFDNMRVQKPTKPGDFDGDGRADISVFRRTTGQWFIKGSSVSSTVAWGGGLDVPVAADYDGDGKVDVSVYRPSTGT